MSGSTIEALKALGQSGHCPGCGAWLGVDPGQRIWCKKKKCIRLRSRAYTRDHRGGSRLVRVVLVTRLGVTFPTRALVTLACGCQRSEPLSKAGRSSSMHCANHPDGFADAR